MKPAHTFRTTSSCRMQLLALTLFAVPFTGSASAQSTTGWKYEVGLRTTFMLSAMSLSELGGGFADLPAGGKSMPHSSSLFVLWPLGTHTRLGVETLVGNSYPESDTEMLFQATGVTAEYRTAGTWFVAASVQVGGIIASATQSSDPDTEGNARRAGEHFKASGYFFAPQASFGRRFNRFDVRAIGKQVWQFGADGLDAFDSFYAGISVAHISR